MKISVEFCGKRKFRINSEKDLPPTKNLKRLFCTLFCTNSHLLQHPNKLLHARNQDISLYSQQLQWVALKSGIRYINDSRVSAALKARGDYLRLRSQRLLDKNQML